MSFMIVSDPSYMQKTVLSRSVSAPAASLDLGIKSLIPQSNSASDEVLFGVRPRTRRRRAKYKVFNNEATWNRIASPSEANGNAHKFIKEYIDWRVKGRRGWAEDPSSGFLKTVKLATKPNSQGISETEARTLATRIHDYVKNPESQTRVKHVNPRAFITHNIQPRPSTALTGSLSPQFVPTSSTLAILPKQPIRIASSTTSTHTGQSSSTASTSITLNVPSGNVLATTPTIHRSQSPRSLNLATQANSRKKLEENYKAILKSLRHSYDTGGREFPFKKVNPTVLQGFRGWLAHGAARAKDPKIKKLLDHFDTHQNLPSTSAKKVASPALSARMSTTSSSVSSDSPISPIEISNNIDLWNRVAKDTVAGGLAHPFIDQYMDLCEAKGVEFAQKPLPSLVEQARFNLNQYNLPRKADFPALRAQDAQALSEKVHRALVNPRADSPPLETITPTSSNTNLSILNASSVGLIPPKSASQATGLTSATPSILVSEAPSLATPVSQHTASSGGSLKSKTPETLEQRYKRDLRIIQNSRKQGLPLQWPTAKPEYLEGLHRWIKRGAAKSPAAKELFEYFDDALKLSSDQSSRTPTEVSSSVGSTPSMFAQSQSTSPLSLSRQSSSTALSNLSVTYSNPSIITAEPQSLPQLTGIGTHSVPPKQGTVASNSSITPIPVMQVAPATKKVNPFSQLSKEEQKLLKALGAAAEYSRQKENELDRPVPLEAENIDLEALWGAERNFSMFINNAPRVSEKVLDTQRRLKALIKIQEDALLSEEED